MGETLEDKVGTLVEEVVAAIDRKEADEGVLRTLYKRCIESNCLGLAALVNALMITRNPRDSRAWRELGDILYKTGLRTLASLCYTASIATASY